MNSPGQTTSVNEAPTLRSLLGTHLPFLRRYVRALVGNQLAGDQYVRAALEAVLADPAMLEIDRDAARLSLFRMFHAFWNPLRTGADAPTLAGTPLDALPITGREALLLTAMEGFSVADAALIIGRSTEVVAQEVADARAQIAAAIRSRVLIIEDEPIIAMHLGQMVESMGHEVVGMAMTRNEAVRMAGAVRPDLVLADIQLADGSSGIDAVEIILVDFDVPVIFITGYPERLLTGERVEPAYLVTKPFDPETVIATVGQALLTRSRGISES
jgi:CheY-like chemotaxis protein